jgi:glutamine amidotransferase
MDSPTIAVVDYGAGNLRSVARAIAHVGGRPLVTERGDDLASADAVVLPGVGAAGAAMHGLADRGLIDPIRRAVDSGRPFLGVCLGLQVLLEGSDEDGGVACLGILPGQIQRLPPGLKVPHMGWNQVVRRRPHRLLAGIADGADFYFVHSYAALAEPPDLIVGETEYGATFASVIARNNVAATQFHPEKSADDGLRLYANLVQWAQEARMVGAPGGQSATSPGQVG